MLLILEVSMVDLRQHRAEVVADEENEGAAVDLGGAKP